MHELAVIGAGPAGMAAAAEAAGAGLRVLLVDEQARAGGQIYRDVGRVTGRRASILGADYMAGAALVEGLARPGIAHLAGAAAWAVEEAPGGGWSIAFSRDGRAGEARARRLLIATGALERAMPLPGWTLPGVMTAGAAQILLKGSGVVPRRAVLAGAGPLIYLVAVQMLRAGVPPLALVETQSRADIMRAGRHWAGALRGWRYMAKGAGMLAALRRAGVRRYPGAEGLVIEGAGRAEALRFRQGGREERIGCETVLLHHGVVPNTQLARALGVAHRWEAGARAFVPDCDRWGAVRGRDGLFIAGDGAGIGGARRAAIAGRLAALAIAAGLGAITGERRDTKARPLWRARAREGAVRPFLDAAYPPCAEALAPHDDTIICRCEEVTAGEIRAAAALGSLGPNQAKVFTRAGMGPCQGRYCGLSVTAILAAAGGADPQATGHFRIRPPIKPVTLGELAAMQGDDETSAQ